jgi:hypothetical protein
MKYAMPCDATLGKLIYARSHPILFIFKLQPNALLLRQNFIIRKKWVLHTRTLPSTPLTARLPHVAPTMKVHLGP